MAAPRGPAVHAFRIISITGTDCVRELHTEITIDAPVERVWEVLTDFPQFRTWNPFVTQAEGEVRDGARLHVRIEPPGGRAMTFTPTVVRAVPNEELRWLGRLLLPGVFDGEHAFRLSPTSSGGTRFIQREQFRGLLVPLLWNSVSTNTKRGFEAMNAALKERAEALTAAGKP